MLVGSFFYVNVKVKFETGFVININFTTFAVLYGKTAYFFKKKHLRNKKCQE
jgi:hypothetical protein